MERACLVAGHCIAYVRGTDLDQSFSSGCEETLSVVYHRQHLFGDGNHNRIGGIQCFLALQPNRSSGVYGIGGICDFDDLDLRG